MSNFDLNMRKSLILELRQQLELERRKNTLLKNKIDQKRNEDFFTTQTQMKLRPLGPSQNSKASLTKEAILKLSKDLRHTHMPHGIALKFQTQPQPTHGNHDAQLQHALKKFKHRLHAKKRHVEQHVAHQEQIQHDEFEKQHRAHLGI